MAPRGNRERAHENYAVRRGLGLLAHPPTVIQLLLGSEIAGEGIFMSRIAGIALIALGVACWPGGVARGLQK